MIGSKIRLKWAVIGEEKEEKCVSMRRQPVFIRFSGFGILQDGERILRKTKPAAGKQNASAEGVKAV